MTKPLIGIGSDVLQKQGERDRAFVYTTYVDSLRRAGAIPLLIPPQPENAADVVDDLDGILLAGGDDFDPAAYGEPRHPAVEPMDPRRQENELSLARIARERGIPTLGICLGVQVMNVAAGGTLIQHIESDIDHTSEPSDRHRHEVAIDGGTRLARIVGGLEDPRHPFYVGVQWHPEDMSGEESASAIFGAFVEAARKHAEMKRRGATELSPAAALKSE